MTIESHSTSDSQLFEEGCRYFNEGNYFEAHESWEELWTQAQGQRHAYLQCLIQVSVALHHASRENWAGARKLLASSLDYLEKGRLGGDEVDLERLKDHILDFELAIQKRLNDASSDELPFFEMPRVEESS